MTEQSPFLVQVNQAFNVPAPDAFVLEGFGADTTHPNIPVRKDEYVLEKKTYVTYWRSCLTQTVTVCILQAPLDAVRPR